MAVERVQWSRIQTAKRASRYRTTEKYIYRLYHRQRGLCGVCGDTLAGSFVVDHDHATGEVRGLLCQSCNKLLGFAFDSVDRLQGAIRYLKGE